MIIRKSAREIELMAAAGAVVAETLALLEERLEPGISMIELDAIADAYILSRGATPTSKGYKGFPAATCISPNDMIVHGIPSSYRAAEGDIISFDVGVTKDGLIADSAATFGSARSRTRRSACSTSAWRRSSPASRRRRSGAVVGGHLRGDPAGRRGRRLLGRPQPRRPRRRQGLPRGAADPELRPAHRGSPSSSRG